MGAESAPGDGGAHLATWLVFGMVSIAASRLGTLAPRVGLPLITGYLVVGALAGPFVLGMIAREDVPRLGFVTQFALAFIAFSAGSELYLPELRALFKRILYMTSSIAVVTFTICCLMILALAQGGLVPFMAPLELGCQASVAAIAASIMVARSPASAIAVVKEMKAKGIFTSTLLGVTVLCDVYVLLGFTLTTTIAESECKGEGFSAASLGIMVATMMGSLVFGFLLGKFLVFLMWFKRIPARYLILPLGLAVFIVTNWFTEWTHDNLPYVLNFEPLLMCITAGYVCTNTSRHRHRFIQVLQHAGPYVFLPFFTLTGASLDLKVLVQSFGFAAIVALIRAGTIFLGSASGGWLAGQAKEHNTYIWMTLLTQAGVSLGLASEVGMSFPEWGRAFQTAIISVVLVNQIVGPILFKIAIRRVGEAGKAASGDAFDVDAVLPTAIVIGDTAEGMMLSVRLLKQQWKVVMVTATEQRATAATDALKRYAEAARFAEEREKGAVTKVVDAVAKPVAQVQRSWWAFAFGRAGQQQLRDDDAAAGTTATAPAAAPAQPSVEHDEHEHGPPPMETLFSAVGLMDALPDGAPDPFASSAVSDGPHGAAAIRTPGQRGAGTDFHFAKLVGIVQSARTLQAAAVMLDSDDSNYTVASVIDAAIAAAPKSSHLHSVRVLALVLQPSWAEAYMQMGVVPFHAMLHGSSMAAKVLTAPCNKPVTLLAPIPNNDEFARTLRAGVEGEHAWALWTRFKSVLPAMSTGTASSLSNDALTRVTAARASMATGVAAGMKEAFQLSIVAEEVPVWERNNYLDELDGMTDNRAFEAAPVDAREARRHELEMFGSITTEHGAEDGDEDGAEQDKPPV